MKCTLQKSRPLTTYIYRAPETLVKEGPHSYEADIWSLGISIVHCDTVYLSFVQAKMRYSDLYLLLRDILSKRCGWLGSTTNALALLHDPPKLSDTLRALRVKRAAALPWGATRGTQFQHFISQFLKLVASRRPLAHKLLEHPYVVTEEGALPCA